MKKLLLLLFLPWILLGQPKIIDPGMLKQNSAINGQGLVWSTSNDRWEPGNVGGAPTDATYITQTPNGTLSAEQALSSLATGILKNTTGTGVLSIAVGADLPSHTHATSDVTSGTFADARIAASNVTQHQAALSVAISQLTGGPLGLSLGGSGANLSATGPGFLKQATLGANVTVAALAASDMPSSIDAAKISAGTVSNTEFDFLNGVTSAIQTQLNNRVLGSRNLTAGVGLSGGGDLTADRTFTFDPTELTGLTWSNDGSSSFTWTFDILAGTDPVVTFSNNAVNISTGNLQVGGSNVITAGLNDNTWGDGTDATIAWTYNVLTGTDPVVEYGNNTVNVATGTLQQGGTGVVLESRTLTGGVGIAAIGDLSANRTITFDATELTGLTWSAGGSASFTWTYNVSTGTDPVITFGNGIVNVSTGALQEAGVDVATLSGTETLTNKTIDGGVATTTHAAGANFVSTLRHATDCTAITDGVAGELCVELDSENLYSCQPTAGGCDTAGEWILTGDGSAGTAAGDTDDIQLNDGASGFTTDPNFEFTPSTDTLKLGGTVSEIEFTGANLQNCLIKLNDGTSAQDYCLGIQANEFRFSVGTTSDRWEFGVGSGFSTPVLTVDGSGIMSFNEVTVAGLTFLLKNTGVDGEARVISVENGQTNTGASTNETANIEFAFGGVRPTATILAGKESDYTSAANRDSFLAFRTELSDTINEWMRIPSDGGVRWTDSGTQPTCDAGHRGTVWYEAAGAGVKDQFEVCAKDAGDAYAWRVLY